MKESAPRINGQEWLPTRHSLLSRLRDWDDQESWRDFFNRYGKLIYGVALKSGLSDGDAQDVVQETVMAVAQKMHDFKYDPARGSFKSWLLLITRRRIADQLRKQYRRVPIAEPHSGAATGTGTVERIAEPAGVVLEAIWNQEWNKHLVDTAIQRVKRLVNLKQYQIFHAYALKNGSVTEVARTFGVSAGQVYLIKFRISRLIRKEFKKLQDKIT